MPSDERNSEPRLPAELADVEQLLARLQPDSSRIDRDRLMFDAGAAHAARELVAENPGNDIFDSPARQPGIAPLRKQAAGWKWQAATAAALLLACVTGTLYIRLWYREPLTVPKIVYVPSKTDAWDDSALAAKQAASPTPLSEQDPRRQTTADSKAVGVSPPGTASAIRLLAWPTATVAYRSQDSNLDYLALRQLVLTRGVQALPATQYESMNNTDPADKPPASPPTMRELMNRLLPQPQRDKPRQMNTAANGGLRTNLRFRTLRCVTCNFCTLSKHVL